MRAPRPSGVGRGVRESRQRLRIAVHSDDSVIRTGMRSAPARQPGCWWLRGNSTERQPSRHVAPLNRGDPLRVRGWGSQRQRAAGIATALVSPTDCAQGRDGATTRDNGVRQAVGLSGGEILAKVPLFSGLLAEERERLGRLLRPRRYARGQVIFLEGDAGTALCLIAEGRIRIQLTGADGREVVLTVYGPGEILGELALLDGEPRSTDAIAQDAARVFWLQRANFAAFLDSHPYAVMTMLASLSRRLRHMTRVVRDATLRDVPARLARVLLDLAARHGQAIPQGIRVESRMTQAELAALVGASRESVNRALRSFEQRGLIDWDSSRIMIKRPEQLRVRADGA